MGSKDCKDLEKILRQILSDAGVDSEITMSDDIDLFIKYKITKTPALLIDELLIHNEDLQLKSNIRNQIIEYHDKNHKAS